jgi:hypothetical protein
MSEFWGFHATRSPADFDRDALVETLSKLKITDAAVFHNDGWLYVVTASGKKLEKFADTVVQFFDHESSAWDFSVYVKGKRIGGGTFGENCETGAEDEGFDGDLVAVAKALGVDAKKLEKTFVADSGRFLTLAKLVLFPVGPGDIENGAGIFMDGEDEARLPSRPPKRVKPKRAPRSR